MIVAAAWFNFLVANCVIGSFSILYISYTEGFQATKAATGWIGSLQYFMMGIVGKCNHGYTERIRPLQYFVMGIVGKCNHGYTGRNFMMGIVGTCKCNHGYTGRNLGSVAMLN